jgi:hypothetical protein
MGVVYKARDPKIDRFVAVKTISLLDESLDEALEYRERFFQEARLSDASCTLASSPSSTSVRSLTLVLPTS